MSSSMLPLPNMPRYTHSHNTRSSFSPASHDLRTMGCAKPRRTTGESLKSLLGASLTVVGDNVYVFGGFDLYTDEVFNTLYTLHFGASEELEWKQVIYTKGRPPSKRNDHSATLWGTNRLVIFGGKTEDDRHCNDVAILDLDTLTWWHPETTGAEPNGRIRHSASIHNDTLYVAGGVTADQKFADTLLVLDLRTFEWRPQIPFVRRSQHSSFVHDGCLYPFGGLNEDMHHPNLVSFIDLHDPRSPVTNLTINSPSAPTLSDQSFFQVCGDELVVIVTQPLAQTGVDPPAGTSLWTLNLRLMQWQCRDLGDRYENFQWYAFAMAEHAPFFHLFGTTNDDSENHFACVLRINLEDIGLVPVPPPQLGSDLSALLTLPDSTTPPQQRDGNGLLAAVCHADFAIRSDADGGRIPVHRLILAARWPHFIHLLQSEMAESKTEELILPEPSESLYAFVRFLYMDALDDHLSSCLVCDLLLMSDLYQLPRLKALCTRQLYESLDIYMASKIYHCAGRVRQTGLENTALRFIFNHFGEVSRTDEFRNLPPDILWQIWDATPKNAGIVAYENGRMLERTHVNSGNNTTVNGSSGIHPTNDDQPMGPPDEEEEEEEEEEEREQSPMES